MDILDNVKVKQLNRKLKSADLKTQLEKLNENSPAQIQALQSLAYKIKGTELEGLPFTIALMRSKLLPDKAIAEELGIPLKAVRKYSQVHGFETLITQMAPAIWSDLVIASQACLMHHISVEKNLEAAKWLLEVVGQVASSRPLQNHTHQTLVLNGNPLPGLTSANGPAQLSGGGGGPQLTVENLAEAMFQRLSENQKNPSNNPPPITISHND